MEPVDDETIRQLKANLIELFTQDRAANKLGQAPVLGAYQAVLVELYCSMLGSTDAAQFYYAIADDLAIRAVKDNITE